MGMGVFPDLKAALVILPEITLLGSASRPATLFSNISWLVFNGKQTFSRLVGQQQVSHLWLR